jgi:hypothetical protein
MPQNPLEAEYDLPDRLKTRTVEEELLASIFHRGLGLG